MRLFSALGLCLLAALPVRADVAGTEPMAPREVQSWLVRIQSAASQHNFQGTLVVSGGGAVSSARVAHYLDGRNQLERSEALDGPARLVYRRNDVVQTVWPSARLAVVEERRLDGALATLLPAVDAEPASAHYEMRQLRAQRVAGHDAAVLQVVPRDAYRYGYRLWADQGSGLLLRADLIGAHGEVLESSAFSEVSIDVRGQPETVLAPMRRLGGLRVTRPTLAATSLAREGWIMRVLVPGFREVSCVRRPIDAIGDPRPAPTLAADAPAPALQSIYSDGLAYVSLFIEPLDARRDRQSMLTSVGPTQTLMQPIGEWWVTAVGDVPPATLRLLVEGLGRRL